MLNLISLRIEIIFAVLHVHIEEFFFFLSDKREHIQFTFEEFKLLIMIKS